MKRIVIFNIIILSLFISNKSYAWFWLNERKSACGSVEWEFQNAFECLAYPHVWKRWSELHGMYNWNEPEGDKGVTGCPVSINKLDKYNLSSDEKLKFITLTKVDRETGLIYKYRDLEGIEFCDSAEINGWIDEYLESKKN
jgi:hypothetical protein